MFDLLSSTGVQDNRRLLGIGLLGHSYVTKVEA